MKTLLASTLLAVLLGGCSSTNPETAPASTVGTVAQGGACKQTAECESPLTCGYPLVVDAGGSCSATGVCVAIGAGSVRSLCPCGSGSAVDMFTDGVYATVPVDTTRSCSAAGTGDGGSSSDGGTTPAPTDAGSGGG